MTSYLKQAREWAYPTLKSSAFLSRGVLTPEEFVAAGDELVYKCPTWSWEGGDPRRVRGYLPPNKQYLITRNVPCRTRVSELEGSVSLTTASAAGDGDGGGSALDGDGDDEWVVSSIVPADERRRRRRGEGEAGGGDDDDDDDAFDVLDGEGEVVGKTAAGVPGGPRLGPGMGGDDEEREGDDRDEGGEEGEGEEGEEEEYADMADFEDDGVDADEAAAPPASSPAAGGSPGDVDDGDDDDYDDNLMKVRTYDLSITYDKYYQTPRVWMMGYSAESSRQPLTGQEMMEDVMTDYANRTVTIECHPHVDGPHASIHPCQHGAVMKTIVRNLTGASSSSSSSGGDGDGGGGGGGGNGSGRGGEEVRAPAVETYLFIFLKFVSSIIPTISYDFTMDVTASTRK